MQGCESSANTGNIFKALGNRDLKRLKNSSIKTKDNAFEEMQKSEFMEFKNQYINNNKKIEGLGKAWLEHCLSVKQGISQQKSPILAELFKNEGFFHQVFTRSAVKAFSLGYIYENGDIAFNKGGKFNITKFIDFVYNINKKVASNILPRYLDNIKKENDEVQFGKCKLSLNLANIKAEIISDSFLKVKKIKFPSLSKMSKKEIGDCNSFTYKKCQKVKELNEEDNIGCLKKEHSTASEEEQGQLPSAKDLPVKIFLPTELNESSREFTQLDETTMINVDDERNIQNNKNDYVKDTETTQLSPVKNLLVEESFYANKKDEDMGFIHIPDDMVTKFKKMMNLYEKELITINQTTESKIDNFNPISMSNSMFILQQGLKDLGIVKAEKKGNTKGEVLFEGDNGYQVKAKLDSWDNSEVIKYEFIEIITPSNKGIQAKILIMFNNYNAVPGAEKAGQYPFIRKELFDKDKYDLVMIMDGTSPKRKIKLSIEKIGHFMPLIIDNKNNLQFAIDPKGSIVTCFARPHPVNDDTINKLNVNLLSDNSELEQNMETATFEKLVKDMKRENLTQDDVDFIKLKMKRNNFPVKAMNIQGAISTNCVRLGSLISLEILAQYLENQSINLGAITKDLNSIGEDGVARIVNLLMNKWIEDFCVERPEEEDASEAMFFKL